MKFNPILQEGVILSRKGQFIIFADVNGAEQRCHCPTTGRIGNIEITGRPCLLSKSGDPSRKTQYTVEAISLNHIEDANKSWIGINQNAANRYVEECLKHNMFPQMLNHLQDIRREQFLGKSKLDFLADDTYIEVKTPLQHLQLQIPSYIRTKKMSVFSSTDRLIKHSLDLVDSLKDHQRAIMLLVFVYDNPGFRVINRSNHYEKVQRATQKSFDAGVELWQANFKITPYDVILNKYFRVQVDTILQSSV